MSHLEDHGIWTNLRGTVCVCGGEKRAGRSFCRRDYFKLPRELRNALYASNGYPETFRRSCEVLGLTAPEGPKSLAEVFPHRGAARRNPFRRFPRSRLTK